MEFDVEKLRPMDTYKLMAALIVPRPIAWTVTQSIDGTLNAAPFSFFNVMSGTPPVVVLGLGSHSGREHDSTRNIRETAEFVINLVAETQIEAMSFTSGTFDPDVDELQLAGIPLIASSKVKPPRIAGSPASFECERMITLEVGPQSVVILGRVVAIHVRDELMQDASKFYVDAQKLHLVARMGSGGWYGRTRDTFELPA